ncbi:MAG: recombination mediator RecR [Bacilli bacterium]|nr:recombination mediator RecR [Bacilli bacterium]MDD4718235.1 recombination mediator RecR [Bacilli bacterium]
MNYPTTIMNLIECFKKLPGIGEKTAERLALSTLNLDDEIINLFSQSILDAKLKIKRCVLCNNFTENEKCDICLSKNRDTQIICIVQEPKNIIMMEKSNVYNGQYHVIDKLISPLEGVNPSDINISTLESRIKENNIKEIMIVLKQSIEGETTTLYITKMLEKTGVKITKIAQGVPHGADMDYIDYLTLEKAIEDRKEVS